MGFSTLTSFPSFPGLTLPVVRTPIWHSVVQESVAGVETVQQFWTYPRYQYQLDFSVLRQAAAYGEIQSLIAFFHSHYARLTPFQYTDPNDFLVSSTAPQTFASADGVTTSWQLIRASGGFVEPVFAISTIASITVGATTVTSSAYTITNAGIISFSSIPPAGQALTWAGTFNWFCRFNEDKYEFSQFTASSDYQGPLWELKKLQFTSIKFGA